MKKNNIFDFLKELNYKKIKLLVISKVYKTNNAPGIQAMPQ